MSLTLRIKELPFPPEISAHFSCNDIWQAADHFEWAPRVVAVNTRLHSASEEERRRRVTAAHSG